jgi:heat shock protein HslJ
MVRLTVALLVVAIGLCACAGETSEPDPSGAPDVDDRTFVATSITDRGRSRALVDDTELRLTFRDDQLGIEAGCNHLSGSYELDGDRLVVGPIGGTEMGCPQPLMDQDAWLAGVLAGESRLRLVEDDLTLTSGEVVIELTDRETVSPDLPLTDTRWFLDSLLEGDAVSSVPGGVRATLVVRDGRASVDAGCNSMGWDVEVDGDTITFANGTTTDMGCPDDTATVEHAVATVFDGEATWTITERSLTITNGDRGLGFRAE